MKKAFLIAISLLLISAAFGVEWTTTKYGYSFYDSSDGRRYYRSTSISSEECFQPSTTQLRMNDSNCKFTRWLSNSDGSASNWGCFICKKSSGTAYIDQYSPYCSSGWAVANNAKSCFKCPTGQYWSDEQNACVDDCSQVTERAKRYQCFCEKGGLGVYSSHTAEQQICNDNGQGLCPQNSFVNVTVQCSNGKFTSNQLYAEAVKQWGKESAEAFIHGFIYDDIKDDEFEDPDFYNSGTGGDGDNIGENSDNTSSGNTGGGSGSAGGNTGENSGGIDGDNPDPFAPKPTRPGVVGGDDSGTGDDTGGSETGGESGGSSTGSDNNSTSGGGSGSGNNEYADGNGTESGILDELKAFHEENINAVPNGDKKAAENLLNLNSSIYETSIQNEESIFKDAKEAVNEAKTKTDDALNSIKDAINTIKENGFFQFQKNKISSCRVEKSFELYNTTITIPYDFCEWFSKFYNIFYFLSFVMVCYMGYKYILSKLFHFGGAE